MPTEAKQAAVAELTEALSASDATIVADYRGLTVSDIQAVRRSLRSEGITYRVVKNRLAKIAAREAGRDELTDFLDGPTGLAMGAADEVTLARAFLDAIRPYKSVVVRGAVIGGTRMDAASITRLSQLPPRDVLLAQLAGGMASPLATMASLFAAPLRNLGSALSQLAAKKGEQEGASQATAVVETEPEKAVPEAQAEAEAPAEAEAEATAEAPAEDAAQASTDTGVEAEAEATAEAPVEDAAEASTDTGEEAEAEASAEAPAEARPAADASSEDSETV